MSDMISFRVEDNLCLRWYVSTASVSTMLDIMSSVNVKFKDICKMWCLAMEPNQTLERLQNEDKDLQAVMSIN